MISEETRKTSNKQTKTSTTPSEEEAKVQPARRSAEPVTTANEAPRTSTKGPAKKQTTAVVTAHPAKKPSIQAVEQTTTQNLSAPTPSKAALKAVNSDDAPRKSLPLKRSAKDPAAPPQGNSTVRAMQPGPRNANRPRRRIRRNLLAILFLVVLVGAGGLFLLHHGQGATKPYRGMPVVTGPLSLTVSASGTVEPLSQINVGSQVSGIVDKVLVEPNQRVTKGQELARLDRDLLESEKRKREIATKQARIALQLLEIEMQKLETSGSELANKKELKEVACKRAETASETAARNLKRAEQASKLQGAISEVEVDEARLNACNAKAEHDASLLEVKGIDFLLNHLQDQKTEMNARIDGAKLDIQQAEAFLEMAETNLKQATITSPLDGLVLERKIEEGQTIAAQFTTPEMFTIISDLSAVRLVADVDEAQIGKLQVGQTARFRADAFPNDRFEAKIEEIRLKHAMRNKLVTYPVIFRAANQASEQHPDGKLRPGMTVFLDIGVGQLPAGLQVPVEAVRFVPDEEHEEVAGRRAASGKAPEGGLEATVYRIMDDGRLEAVDIFVGASDSDHYQLFAGPLKEGDLLATGVEGERK